MRGRLWAMAALVILGTTACATGPTAGPAAAPGVNVTGEWRGTWQWEEGTAGGGPLSAKLKQDGAKVTGDLQVGGPARQKPGRFEGTISGNDIKLVDPPGWLTVKGNEMTGEVSGLVRAKVSLRRVQ
jgi:hypothetical protein